MIPEPLLLNLRVLFNVSTAELIWEKYFKDTDFHSVNFEALLQQKFEEVVHYLQNKTHYICADMLTIAHVLNPVATYPDICHFFHEVKPLQKILEEEEWRNSLKYSLRCEHTKWQSCH